MKILQYFEKAWVGAAIASVIVGLYNLITLQQITTRVYFPFMCAMFCVLIWMNIRGQRRFREKMMGEKEEKHPDGEDTNL